MDGVELRIDISIRNYQAGGNLQLSESVMVDAASFADMASVLARFHDVLETIKGIKERA